MVEVARWGLAGCWRPEGARTSLLGDGVAFSNENLILIIQCLQSYTGHTHTTLAQVAEVLAYLGRCMQPRKGPLQDVVAALTDTPQVNWREFEEIWGNVLFRILRLV